MLGQGQKFSPFENGLINDLKKNVLEKYLW